MIDLNEIIRYCEICNKSMSFIEYFYSTSKLSNSTHSYNINELKSILSFFSDTYNIILCPKCETSSNGNLFVNQYTKRIKKRIV